MSVAVSELFISESDPLREVVQTIDRSGRFSIALMVDESQRLIATVTDGDIRRAIMAGLSLSSPASSLLPMKALLPQSEPVTAPDGTDSEQILQIMRKRAVRQLPIVDSDGRVTDVVILADFLPQKSESLQAVIMAGGFGERLQPLTNDTPKPMLPVQGKPLLERTVNQLRDAGIHHIVVTTHYKKEKIVDHFGDGRNHDVNLTYVHEEEPLGTGGALGLMKRPEEPILVINGDILTQVDFRTMHAYHQSHKADLTIGVRHFSFQVPYGVIECESNQVLAVNEKPKLNCFVNAGIYLLEPIVFQYIKGQKHFHMTDLVQWVLEAGRSVVSFPIIEKWIDIGRLTDYEEAQINSDDDYQY